MDVCSIFLIHHCSDCLCELWIGKIKHTIFLIGTSLWEWTPEKEKQGYGTWNYLDHDILAYYAFWSFETWWLLYIPQGLTLNISTVCPHSVFMWLVWISEQRVIISLHSMNWFVFINLTWCIFSSGKNEFLNIIQINHSL